MSEDERWMYIGAPGVNKVYAYGRVDWESQRINVFGDSTTTAFYIGSIIQIDAATQLSVGVAGTTQILNVDYTIPT